MRTTLNLDDSLMLEAMNETGIQEKTRLIHMGLRALIRLKAGERLAGLYGRIKEAKAPPRRREKMR